MALPHGLLNSRDGCFVDTAGIVVEHELVSSAGLDGLEALGENMLAMEVSLMRIYDITVRPQGASAEGKLTYLRLHLDPRAWLACP
ncbi:hypothetical protein [Bradyrhizobium sp. NP1]|uniref:hypothetical protein n=1 Tax=Bradyrhizobium sp. NP1 TaxID=3049772 RepID=UPI0025A61FD6|nr:hypothetical protein [Bradyrhizobium sp. NP1]WJR76785.1 hypothetical protein QOU61_29100 [Bradyrhizobium sp. NP1]